MFGLDTIIAMNAEKPTAQPKVEVDGTRSRATTLAARLHKVAANIANEATRGENTEGCIILEQVLDANDLVNGFLGWYLDEK